MSCYDAVEAALVTLVQGYGGGALFGDENCRRNDWTVLDARGVDQVAHVQMGADSVSGPTVEFPSRGTYGWHGATVEVHTLQLTIAVPRRTGHGGDAEAANTVVALADDVAAYLEQYPTMNGTPLVVEMLVSRQSVPEDILRQGDAVGAFVAQRITVQVLCESE